MAQPLFMEVTHAKTRKKVLVGLAHISTIVPGEGERDGAVIAFGPDVKFEAVETFDQIRKTLGSDMGGVRWGS